MTMSEAMRKYRLIVGSASYRPLRWGATDTDWRGLYHLTRDGMDDDEHFFVATGRTPEEAVARVVRKIAARAREWRRGRG